MKRPSLTVTDEMIAEELEGLRKAHATLAAPAEARPVTKGRRPRDFLCGRRRPQASSRGIGRRFESSSVPVQFLPELDEGLTGTSAGEEKEIALYLRRQSRSPRLSQQICEVSCES